MHSTNIRKFVDPIKAVYQSHCRIWLGQCQNRAEFYHITCALPVTALVPWQYENATLRNKVGMYIDIVVISSGSIAFLVDIFTIPSVQRHAINVRRLAKLQGSKASFATRRAARGQWIMNSLSKRFKVPQIFYHESWKAVIRDVNLASGDNYHWKILLLICNWIFSVGFNKRTPHRSFLVTPDTISKYQQLSHCDIIDT